MTQQIYTVQQLQTKTLTAIRLIYDRIGATVKVADERRKSAWAEAIVTHQTNQIQKVDDSEAVASLRASQTVAQAELETFVEQQAQEVAPEIEFTDIDGFYNFEAQVNGEVIAELSHDAFNDENPWYVSVSGVEVYRSTLYCEATNWVKTQYMAGILAKHQPTETVVLTDARVERALTIEVLEQHGDEFVVHNCENDHYYVVRPNHVNPKERCECADCHYRGVKCKHHLRSPSSPSIYLCCPIPQGELNKAWIYAG